MIPKSKAPTATERSAATVLSPADHEHFIAHGFLVLKRAVGPDVVAAALEKLALPAPDTSSPEVEACCSETVAAAVAELAGPRYVLRHRFSDHHPRAYDPDAVWRFQQIHLDDDYPTLAPSDWVVSSFTFLTPVRPRGGALVYIDGSHRFYRTLMSETLDRFAPNADLTGLGGEGTELLAEPGDVLVVHHLLGHCGTNNVADPEHVRQVLLFRWYPDRRVAPGHKPFDDMSTIEKSLSNRYLAERFGIRFRFPEVAAGAAHTLRDGFAGEAGIVGQAALHIRGASRLLAIDRADPRRLRHLVSQDLVSWRPVEDVDDAAGLDLSGGPLAGLNALQAGDRTFLCATREDAGSTLLLASDDLARWERLAEFPDSRGGQVHFNGLGDATRVAWGWVVYLVAGDGSGVSCRWSGPLGDGRSWNATDPFLIAPADMEVHDIHLASIATEEHFGVVVDVAPAGEPGAAVPWAAITEDAGRMTGTLVPLRWSSPTPPRRIRPFARANYYWLVTYIREQGGRDRLFWGELDWRREPLEVVEIEGPDAMRAAVVTVGMDL
ncbi:MAG TPA: phytanoyl-CoA dioxygenase family protein [Vicinamibacterales bacterium]|nr:phytanoyl-CoA dioxygenase family protein [Vicinamibacterales bacterium]